MYRYSLKELNSFQCCQKDAATTDGCLSNVEATCHLKTRQK